jgi:hypothetical protein
MEIAYSRKHLLRKDLSGVGRTNGDTLFGASHDEQDRHYAMLCSEFRSFAML